MRRARPPRSIRGLRAVRPGRRTIAIGPTYAELARRLGLSPTDVTNELAAARREFRRLVLEALREQCATDEEFEAESRALTG